MSRACASYGPRGVSEHGKVVVKTSQNYNNVLKKDVRGTYLDVRAHTVFLTQIYP